MPKASSMNNNSKRSFLFKSPPRMGKTCAAASAALYGTVHISYFDKNEPVELLKYFHDIIKRPDLLDNIDYDVYGPSNFPAYINKIFDWSAKGCRYETVVTDSLTSLTGAAVNWSLGFRDSAGPKKDDLNKMNLQLIPDFDEYKVETSAVVQAIDHLTNLNANVIWMAHPLPQMKIESAGRSINVTKTVSLVTYGNKVAGLVPGRFTEIYHFGKTIDYSTNPSTHKYVCYTDLIGDDFAGTALNLPKEIDWTNKLFFEVWKEELEKAERR